jgi:hypothetical protein
MVELVTELLLWLMSGYVLVNLELTPGSYGNFPSYRDLENVCGMYAEGTEGAVANCQLNAWVFMENISPRYLYIYSHEPRNKVLVNNGSHI